MTASTVLNILVPTFVVVALWVFFAIVIAGIGFLVRSGVAALSGTPNTDGPAPADFWVGMASLTAFLLFWSFEAAVDWRAWLAPLAVGGLGTYRAFVTVRGYHPVRPSYPALALLAGAVVWLANRCLSPIVGYDLGLYHFASIGYASHFAAIPGLANLHPRLGAGNGHLLFVSFLGSGPMSGIAFHLANGLLVSALLVDVAWRFGHHKRPLSPLFSRRVALLLVPGTLVAISVGLGSRLAGPDLDLATFVFVAVGMLYLVQCVEFGVTLLPAVTSTAALALAGATRPLYWPLAVYAIVVLTVSSKAGGAHTMRRMLALLVLPTALLIGWVMRQSLLSGYPLYPVTVGGLPVDWRVAAETVREANRSVASWARLPGQSPDDVLSSWGWLRPWLRAREHDRDLDVPGLFLAGAIFAASCSSPRQILLRRRWRRPMLLLLAPSVAILAIWFFTAPDPRFVLAPLWLIPIALLAWAIPSPGLRPPRGREAIALGILAAALIVTAMTLARGRMLRPIISYGDGPLGTQPVPRPTLVPFRTRSGLRISRPQGGDQCWQAYLCTPNPVAGLQLRGRTVASGFRVDR